MTTVAGYVRVSRTKEEGISPDLQRSEIRRYAERLGWTVSAFYEDLDLRGWQFAERPALQEMLAEVRAKRIGAVIVYRLDRFSREPLHYYQMVFDLETAGVELHDASEGRYLPGDDMSLLRGLRVLLAKRETGTISKRITDAHAELRAKGRFAGGHAPYGFRYASPGPGLEPDPAEAPWVCYMHDRFQQGWSITRIAKDLNARGVPTRQGKQWLASTVLRSLQRPHTAGGRLSDGRLCTGGNIVPIVSPETWRRTQAMMRGGRERWSAGRTSQGPIPTRLIRCGTCGRSLRVHYRSKGIVQLRCWASGDGACEHGVSIYGHLLEAELQRAIVRGLRRKKAPAARPARASADLALLDQQIAEAQAALERLAVAYADGQMSAPEYQGARRTLQNRLQRATAKRETETTRTQDEALLGALARLWGDLSVMTEHPELLAALPEAKRREVYEAMVEKAVVHPAHRKPRVEVSLRKL